MSWRLDLPEMFRELTIVLNEEHEAQTLESYESLGCEWKDGTELESWKPSKHGVDYPYYLGMDEDGDIFYREMSDITVPEDSELDEDDVDDRLRRMLVLADRIDELVDQMKNKKSEILSRISDTK